MTTDTERLDWLIEQRAYVVEAAAGWIVMTHICEDEFDYLGSNEDSPREAIDTAMRRY